MLLKIKMEWHPHDSSLEHLTYIFAASNNAHKLFTTDPLSSDNSLNLKDYRVTEHCIKHPDSHYYLVAFCTRGWYEVERTYVLKTILMKINCNSSPTKQSKLEVSFSMYNSFIYVTSIQLAPNVRKVGLSYHYRKKHFKLKYHPLIVK